MYVHIRDLTIILFYDIDSVSFDINIYPNPQMVTNFSSSNSGTLKQKLFVAWMFAKTL